MPAWRGDHGIWARRYREINDWERYLVDNGIHVVKVMLNLSKREQAKRFLKRIDHPEKNWKFSPATSGSGATGTTTSRPSKPC
jgi:polyphosphate kinase 2 (PPK2 family)